MTDFTGHPTTELAMQLFREGKVDECLRCLDKLVQAYPEDALAYTIMGAAYHKLGENGMAIGSFEHALAWDDSARAHANVARAYEMVGRTRDAVTHYQTAIQLEPEYKPAADGLARLAPPEQPQETS
jgi:Tfp pilus assembly protein PilF